MAAGLGFKDFVTGEVLTAADVDGYLMQGIWVFASATARDAAVTSPQEGNFAYLKDTNVTTYYTGSAWANLDTTGMTNPMTTTGDIIYSSPGSTPVRLGIGTANQVLRVNSGATAPEWATPASSGTTYSIFRDVKAAGTGGGTFTDGAWRTRDINNTQVNQISGSSIASNQITLPAGTFHIYATAPAILVNNHQVRFYNITDSAVAIQGQSSMSGTGASIQNFPAVSGVIVLTGTKVFELQHRCATTRSTDGFGVNGNFGVDEVYAQVTIAKVA
jgi:hypothetical protein